MKIPHIHKEKINAWADGAEIEKLTEDVWRVVRVPLWNPRTTYRIKPEPKPDVVVVWLLDERYCPFRVEYGNLKATFDGETGKLKSAEVI